ICREPPLPRTGFEAPRSGVNAASPGLDPSRLLLMPVKFGWFRMLKNSARSCSVRCSPNFVLLLIEKSQFVKSGPRKILRPESPNVPLAGGVSAVEPETKHPYVAS